MSVVEENSPSRCCPSWLEQCQLFGRLLPREDIEQCAPCPPQTLYTPFVVLHLMIYQRLHPEATLEQAVSQLLFHFPRSVLPDCKRARSQDFSSNNGAYSRARQRLDFEVVDLVSQHVFDTLVDSYPYTFAGRQAFIIDGTTSPLDPRGKALLQEFPPAENQHGTSPFPLMHLAMAFELSTGAALAPEVGAMYGPHASSEIDLAQGLLERLPEQSLVLGDRNFGVFAFAHAAVSRGHEALLRLTKSRFESLRKKAAQLGQGLWRLKWQPTRQDRKKHPELPQDALVEGWLMEHPLGDGTSLYLFSTLEETVAAMAAVYKLRWGGETNIGDLKGTLSMEGLRGRSPEMVMKELWMTIVSHNLTVHVRRLAAEQAQLQPRQLSYKGVWSLVIAFLQGIVDLCDEADLQDEFDRLLRAAAQRKLPKRKKTRSFPRQAYAKRQKFPTRKRGTDPDEPGQNNDSRESK